MNSPTPINPVFRTKGYRPEPCEEALARFPERDDLAAEVLALWSGRVPGAGPGDPGAVHTAVAAGEPERAAAILARMRVEAGFSPEWFQGWLAHLARLGRSDLKSEGQDWLAARRTADRARIAEARQALAAGAPQQARDHLARVLTLPATNPVLVPLHLSIAQMLDGPEAFARLLAARIPALAEPPSVITLSALANLPDGAERQALVARLKARWPKIALGLLDKPDADCQALEHRIIAARLAGCFDEAEALTAAASDLSARQRESIDLANALPEAGVLRRPLIDLGATGDALASPPGQGEAGPKTLVLVYDGLQSRGGIWASHVHIDLALARRGIPALYMVDPLFAVFFGGVPALGADWAATTEALRRHAQALGAERIVTIGISAGAPGAVTQGLALGASGILLFAPSVTSIPEVREALGERRGPAVAAKAARLAGERAHVPWWYQNLPVTARTHVHVGEDTPVDLRAAELLAPFPGVEIIRHPAPCGHRVWSRMMAEGRFEAALAAILGED